MNKEIDALPANTEDSHVAESVVVCNDESDDAEDDVFDMSAEVCPTAYACVQCHLCFNSISFLQCSTFMTSASEGGGSGESNRESQSESLSATSVTPKVGRVNCLQSSA